MQRTEYWNQTRPTDTQLNWTETSKVNAINQRLRSSAQMGIAWGFQVTVNSVDNTKINVARGEGYTGGMFLVNEFETVGSGQRVSTYTDTPSGTDDIGPAATGQALADYTAGVKNYVSLVYTEVESSPLAERTFPFTNRDTIVTERFVVSVLTETQWNTLDSESLNNRVLVAIVTAKGAGTALTSADIDQFVQPKTLPTTSQPQSITGVTVVGIADVTPLGIGTLRWDPSVNQMFWTAPGDTEGAALTLTDSGVYTLYSNNINYTIDINVIWGSLLLTTVETSENISVRSLYGRSIPMFSAVDQIHRDMVGSGQPSETNPHALTLADIGGGTLDHADLFHVNGISKDADATQLECNIASVGPLDYVLVNSLGGFANSFLVDGVTLTEVSGSNEVHFSTTPFPDTGEYLIYIDSNGTLGKVQIGNALWDTDIYIVDMVNTVAGTGTISWDSTVGTGGFLRYEAPSDGSPGERVYLMESAPGGSYAGYYKLYSSNTDNWVIVYVAGAIGATNSSNITIVKDETDYAEETMLKLCVVNWVSSTEILSNLRDIRSFVTADNRAEAEEDHDTNGQHTKVLQNRLRVRLSSADDGAFMGVAGSTAVYGSALTNVGMAARAAGATGLYGSADTLGVYGYAAGDTGGQFVADNTGVYGSVGDLYGGYFLASNTAIYGSAQLAAAVFGTASLIAVYGYATSVQGVYGSASATGVRGAASSFGVLGEADTYGVTGVAGMYGVKGEADTLGVFGTADVLGVRGYAAVDTAVHGSAGANTGVYGKADTYGVYGKAGNIIGVYGEAPSTGVYGSANTYGVVGVGSVKLGGYFSAPNTALEATATADTAIYAIAANDTAIYAGADTIGIYGEANRDAIVGSALNYAVSATADTATAIYGIASSHYGVVGSALSYGNYGIAVIYGVYGSATVNGVYGKADTYGVYGSGASTGIFGVAPDVGVYGTASTNADAGVVGVYGAAVNTAYGSQATGVYGSVSGATATAVFGDADDGAFGGYFRGSAMGIIVSNYASYAIATGLTAANLGTATVPDSCAFVPLYIAGTRYSVPIFASV